MEFHLLQILAFLFLALVAGHGAVDPEVYFKSVLPNSLMPKAIKDSLPLDISVSANHKGRRSYVMGKPESNFPLYGDAATSEQLMDRKMSALFFLEKEMHPGKMIYLHITKDTSATPTFIPRQVAHSLPFTSNKLLSIYEAFSVKPGSVEAKLMKNTISECEKASNQGEEKYCATSLESMVDFTTSKLGKNVKAISTEVNGKESTTLQEYRVDEVKKLAADNVVVCHQQYYAYAVHYCHKSSNINAYMVSLVGENNLRAKAISVCHEDTASWNPKHLAFQVLNVKPGTYSVCHFLVEGDVAWVPY